jgi:hypothetical protein
MMKCRAILGFALSCLGVVHAETVVLEGEALKDYVAGASGHAFTIADGERIYFFANGAFIDCSPKGSCDQGTYTFEESRVVRKYDNWKLNGSPLMPITFKKDGGDEYFNVRKITSRTNAIDPANATSFRVELQPTDEMPAPAYKPGNTWTWTVKVSPRDQCTSDLTTGMKSTAVVVDAMDEGYVLRSSGAGGGSRIVSRDLSFDVTAQGQTHRSDVLNFPIRPGKKWSTHLRSGNVLTTLTCEVDKFERMSLGKQQVTVAPITCNGEWYHLESRNHDTAIYKYWYAAEVGNFVNRSVATSWFNRPCSVFEFELEARD